MRSISIVGAGRIGRLIARLFQSTGEYHILLIDQNPDALRGLDELPGVRSIVLTAEQQERLREPLTQGDAVISACGYRSNPAIARAAAEAGISYFDLTEDIATTREIQVIAEDAAEGQVFVPQCGLAPGFIGMLGNHMAGRFETLDTLKLRVGALPEFPTNNLMYNLTWSTEGLINEYCNPCHAIRAGKFVELTPLEGLETFSLEGTSFEAFNTSGGLGTLCETLQGRVVDLTYKTIRYQGHQYLMNFLINDLRLGEQQALLKQIVERAVAVTHQDVVLIMVTATGFRDGRFIQETDSRRIYHGELAGQHWGAIQITTASSLCAMVDLFFEKRLPRRGYVRQEQVNFDDFMANRFASCFRKRERRDHHLRDQEE
ncbi:MAG: saccharopine dehydrogenase NADP-binding domain-containing protein [Sedimenticola sp.]|nr:saccharopine dehydrogenase NADP-binding domain-containing protein [Sedimenticola sp.]